MFFISTGEEQLTSVEGILIYINFAKKCSPCLQKNSYPYEIDKKGKEWSNVI